MKELFWTPEAMQDRDEIHDYIEADMYYSWYGAILCICQLQPLSASQRKPQRRFAMKKFSLLLALLVTMVCFALPGIAAEQQKLPDGFTARAESLMNWADAKAWCQQQGGKLPRVGNKDAWDGKKPPRASIDGFGHAEAKGRSFTVDAPTPAGLPDGYYWTGTMSGDKGFPWIINVTGNNVTLGSNRQDQDGHVLCVPK